MFYAAAWFLGTLLPMAISPADGLCQSIQIMIKPVAYRMDGIGTARLECRRTAACSPGTVLLWSGV